MAKTYEPITTYTLSSATNAITFSSIPQTYTDLVLVVNAKSVDAVDNLDAKVGNETVDSGSNYSRTYLTGDGSGAASGRATTQSFARFTYSGYTSSTQTGNQIIHFMNYSNTTTYKTMLNRANNAGYNVETLVNLWRSTSAINIITLNGGSNFQSGSTFTLYGIKAA
jgi:hypothetical protein